MHDNLKNSQLQQRWQTDCKVTAFNFGKLNDEAEATKLITQLLSTTQNCTPANLWQAHFSNNDGKLFAKIFQMNQSVE